jgi:hypothetical protein
VFDVTTKPYENLDHIYDLALIRPIASRKYKVLLVLVGVDNISDLDLICHELVVELIGIS